MNTENNTPSVTPVAVDEFEAAKYLSLSVHTLRQRRFNCKLPVYTKIGRSVRYLITDLDAFINAARIAEI